MMPFRKRLILSPSNSHQLSIKYFMVHAKTRGVFIVRIHLTIWADCVRESEITLLANVIILMYYYLFRWINLTNLCLDRNHFKNRKFNKCHVLLA